VLSGFSKSAGKWVSCGIRVRLWRRAQFCLGQSDFIIADGARDVCEGDHSLDVMNQWGALTMKIRGRCAAVRGSGRASIIWWIHLDSYHLMGVYGKWVRCFVFAPPTSSYPPKQGSGPEADASPDFNQPHSPAISVYAKSSSSGRTNEQQR